MRKVSHYIIILSALVLSSLCSGCGEEATQEAKDCYRILRVQRQDFTLNREFLVKMESRNSVAILPLVSGRLTKVCVEEGARVKKGQPLFVIDQAPYITAVHAAQAQLSTARAALSTAELNLEGKEQLFARQLVGEFDLQRARHAKEEAAAQVEAAQAKLASARTDLGYTTITSPVDGVIDMISVRVGDFLSPAEMKLITYANNNDKLYVYTSLSEEMLSELLQDFECSSYDELFSKLPEVTLYSNSDRALPQKGRIDAISGDVDPTIGAVYLRASFSNPAEMLRSGSNGYIVLPYELHDVIVIPQEAVVDIHNKYLTYKVVNGKAVETEVTVMHYSDGKHYVVTSGLASGDSIVAEGAGLLSDGANVAEKKEKKEKKEKGEKKEEEEKKGGTRK